MTLKILQSTLVSFLVSLLLLTVYNVAFCHQKRNFYSVYCLGGGICKAFMHFDILLSLVQNFKMAQRFPNVTLKNALRVPVLSALRQC